VWPTGLAGKLDGGVEVLRLKFLDIDEAGLHGPTPFYSSCSLIDRRQKNIVPTNGKVRYVSLLLLPAAASYAAHHLLPSAERGWAAASGFVARNSLPNWRLHTQQSAFANGNCSASTGQRPL
jgi:hypothetical protein